MVEAVAGGPVREGGLAHVGEMLLEAFEDFAGARIARRDGTAGAWVAALEVNFADGEADDVAFVFGEELVFPEGGDAGNFESGAETFADVFDGEARQAWRGDDAMGGWRGIEERFLAPRTPFGMTGLAWIITRLGKPVGDGV